MSRAVLTLEVDDAPSDLLGVKEAATMAVEALGWGKVTCVQIIEPEQMRMAGGTQDPPRKDPPPPASGGQAPAHSHRYLLLPPDGCFSCGHYRQAPGQDSAGKPYWGKCLLSGQTLYDVNKGCREWARTAV